HAATVQKFQTAYSIGALVFSPVPGILADASGSYLPAYALFTLQSVVILAVLQVTYRKCGAN
ncbi:MAG: MFS transporter, partial [Oscillospiraceae bacterium]|nr:MFS transporter [Oscillospiraceae bacterium]